jgi:hypothetical protein
MKTTVMIALLLMIMPVGAVSDENVIDYNTYRNSWDLLSEDENDWVCVDYSVNYSRNNPEWGMVILSPSPNFKFQPHMANYKIVGNTLLIHEPQADLTYDLKIVNGTMNVPYYEDFPDAFSKEWERGTYFHFIPNETDVIRAYVLLKDNRGDFFDYNNMSRDDTTNITIELDDNVDVVMIEDNVNSTINGTTILNNETTNDHYIENNDQSESYISIFIRSIKSSLRIFK